MLSQFLRCPSSVCVPLRRCNSWLSPDRLGPVVDPECCAETLTTLRGNGQNSGLFGLTMHVGTGVREQPICTEMSWAWSRGALQCEPSRIIAPFLGAEISPAHQSNWTDELSKWEKDETGVQDAAALKTTTIHRPLHTTNVRSRHSEEVPRENSAPSGPPIDAVVKWFNPDKGFGFVELADGSGDAFLHVAALQAAGHDAVEPETKMSVQVGQGQKGRQVTAVLSVDASSGGAPRAAARPPSRGPFGGGRRRRTGASRSGNRDRGRRYRQVVQSR